MKVLESFRLDGKVALVTGETDLKGVIVFLASEASAYVTGANIAVLCQSRNVRYFAKVKMSSCLIIRLIRNFRHG